MADDDKAQAPHWMRYRIDRLQATLSILVTAQQHPFDARLRSRLPDRSGIYAINQKGVDPGQYLRAGKTSVSLRQRVYVNHFMGDQKGNLRRQLVASGLCKDLGEAKRWIRQNCEVRFLIVEDQAERDRLEHFMLSVLEPKFCD
jgi:hypothetical protein